MKHKTFNMITSSIGFALGTAYVFTDKAGLTANVIGASGPSAGITAMAGIFMIITAMGIFTASMHGADHETLTLERLIRYNKDNEDITPKEEG